MHSMSLYVHNISKRLKNHIKLCGLCTRFRQAKGILKYIIILDTSFKIPDAMVEIQFVFNTTVHSTTKISPYQPVYGQITLTT